VLIVGIADNAMYTIETRSRGEEGMWIGLRLKRERQIVPPTALTT